MSGVQGIPQSKREMIQRALVTLPGQRGTKKEVFGKIQSLFNANLDKNESTYKTLS